MNRKLSVNELGLYFEASKSEAASAAYNVVQWSRIEGQVPVERARAALLSVIRRHPVLTATVVEDEEDIVLRTPLVQDETTWSTFVSIEAGDVEAVAMTLAAEPTDYLISMFRAVVTTSPAGLATGVALKAAHLLVDATSMGMIQRHFDAALQAEPGAPETPVELAAAAVAESLTHEQEEDLLRWAQQCAARLRTTPSSLPLQSRGMMPAVEWGQARAKRFTVPALPVIETPGSAEAARYSPHTLMLGFLQLAISARTAAREFGVALTVTARSFENEAAVGCLVNQAILAAHTAPQMSLGALLEATQDQLHQLIDERDVPFPYVARHLGGKTPTKGHFSQFGFGYHVADARWHTAVARAKYDLKLDCLAHPDHIECVLTFDADCVQEALVDDIAETLSSLLGPERYSTADLIEPLLGLQTAAPDAMVDLHPLERIARHAATSPAATAIEWSGHRLSYAELWSGAAQVAGLLAAEGVGHGTPVGVRMTRGPLTVMACLAVMLAGAVYVPVDHRESVDRAGHIYAVAGVGFELSCSDLPPAPSVRRAALDRLDLCGQPHVWATPPAYGVNAPAYVLFTSGSTGRPKGVVIAHGNLANFVTWSLSEFEAAELERTLFSTSVSFDLSIFEMFAPLASGGTVLVVDDITTIMGVEPQLDATLVNTIPSAATQLVDALGRFPRLRALNLAGEPLAKALADGLLAAMPAIVLRNLYGPTETTTYSTFTRWSPQRYVVDVGRPILATAIRLLDEDLTEVAPDEVGQIYIAGAGVALGYLHAQRATATSFIADPYGPAGSRMYRTGDLGQLAADGRLICKGRADRQVKVNGFRIELDGIEEAMAACPHIREAVALAIPQGELTQLQLHFISPADALADIQAFAQNVLPWYSRPHAWIAQTELPRLSNGKVDRQSLMKAQGVAARAAESADSTASELTETVLDAWRQVFGKADINPDANFFGEGGHSLMAVKLINRIRKAGFEGISVRTLVTHPTVNALARHLSSKPSAPQQPRAHRKVSQ